MINTRLLIPLTLPFLTMPEIYLFVIFFYILVNVFSVMPGHCKKPQGHYIVDFRMAIKF